LLCDGGSVADARDPGCEPGRNEAMTQATAPRLVDRFGRTVDYVRLSLTDRCDLRCVYCMSEDMHFLPRRDILSLEELFQLARAFVELGVRKIRLTGGEPLTRRGVVELARDIAALPGLRELVLTTNGTQLERLAQPLAAAGVKRLNISLDSLDAERFRQLTRVGELASVLGGIEAARQAGFQRVKLNTVVLAGRNEDEVVDLVRFAGERGLDISFIEEMPLGDIDEHDRLLSFYSSDRILADLQPHFTLIPSTETTGGPSRYWHLIDYGTRVGFISPHSHNFCSTCNRVRVTVKGRLLLCLGQEHSADLMAVMREHPGDDERLRAAIVAAMDLKPEGHEFDLGTKPVIFRHMSVTGG
jgi:GTP 3',8-cyclase